MATMLTYDEWQQKKKNEKEISEHLKNAQQRNFAVEQQQESVFTRQHESIVDPDN